MSALAEALAQRLAQLARIDEELLRLTYARGQIVEDVMELKAMAKRAQRGDAPSVYPRRPLRMIRR
jgi:chorismate mutase